MVSFQDLESFRKGRFFKMAMERIWILLGKSLKKTKMEMTVVLTLYILCLFVLQFII